MIFAVTSTPEGYRMLAQMVSGSAAYCSAVRSLRITAPGPTAHLKSVARSGGDSQGLTAEVTGRCSSRPESSSLTATSVS